MSLFLGKIHFYLYNKIKCFEDLEHEIINWAEAQPDLPTADWTNHMYSLYGEPMPNKPLEEIIDTSNIHGWLQGKISSAEKRHAALISKILNVSETYKEPLSEMFKTQGELLGANLKESTCSNTPQEIFNILNDFLLEGMPCDRVTEEAENTVELYSWITTTCLHTTYWNEVGGDVANFHLFRTLWIKSLVNTLNHNFEYTMELVNQKRIHKITKIIYF